MVTNKELLFDLIRATKPSEVGVILKGIGDQADLSANEPFGENQYVWRFYGNTDSNLSTIHLGSKPGRSVTVRITNAIDAVLEERMARGGVTPTSPMEGAKLWFGRPPTASDNGLFNWKDYRLHDFDQLVQVIITAGDEKSEPTIDILDAGIGIAPDEFSNTIVSLQRGNKMKKPYLVGAFGQGGSATIRYSKYTLIVSRHIETPDTIGFTIVKLMRLPEPYKVNAYVYLGLSSEDGKTTVPSCSINGELDYYPTTPNHSVKFWDRGTLVRHYGYELRGLENPLQATPGNLYHSLQCLMFDPLLPFRLIDLRLAKKSGKYKNEVIRGSRNRLMNYTLKEIKPDQLEEEVEEAGELEGAPTPKSILKHYVPRQLVSLRSDSNPCVGIEYWVIFSERKTGEKITLRPSSELFVDRGHPIVGTLNGQNQGDRTDIIFRDLDLPTVSKHIIVHIDASNADRDTRLGLFVSTREGFSEGNEFKELIRLLTEILKDDEDLYALENELIQAVINRETASIDTEVKREIAELLHDAGLEVTQPGSTLVPGNGNEPAIPKPKPWKRPVPQPPLDTLPYPEVTRFDIVYPVDKFSIPLNERHALRIETDADLRYDNEGRLAIRSEPYKLEVASKGELRGGRLKWRLRPTEDALPGEIGEIIASITKPDGTQLLSRLPYEILPSREAKGKKAKGLLPDFDIQPIDPYTERDLLDQLWPDVKEDEIPSLAYKAVKLGGRIIVYYSTAFRSYRSQIERLQSQPGFAQLFQHDYKIWIGYHAILQYMFPHHPALEPEPDAEQRVVLEHYVPQIEIQTQDSERALVAEMQVKQAIKSAELKSKAIKDAAG